MTGWENGKRWSDRFLPEIKRILGEHLISEPPIEEDAVRNTDLTVLKLDAVRIACRVRSNSYLAGYADEFTIRAGRPSGVKSELAKIIEGWGNYFFYGFSDPLGERLSQWILCDLNAFRLWYNQYLMRNKGEPPGKNQFNGDGSSWFVAFKYSDIPGFVLAGGVTGEINAS